MLACLLAWLAFAFMFALFCLADYPTHRALHCAQAKQSDAQELTSGQASTMARNEQVIDTVTGVLCCAVLCCAVLCCAVLYCSALLLQFVLCCAVQCCAVL